MFTTTPAGHTVYEELDQALAGSHAGDILVTLYEPPTTEGDRRVDIEDAIDEEILAGLVCL